MRVALDTNRYADLARNLPEIVEIVERSEEVALPFPVLAELRCGLLKGSRPAANEAALKLFLAKPTVRVLYPDEQTTHEYARVWDQLRRHGKPIPVNDIWIAALVLQHGMSLCARDAHFDLVQGLQRVGQIASGRNGDGGNGAAARDAAVINVFRGDAPWRSGAAREVAR